MRRGDQDLPAKIGWGKPPGKQLLGWDNMIGCQMTHELRVSTHAYLYICHYYYYNYIHNDKYNNPPGWSYHFYGTQFIKLLNMGSSNLATEDHVDTALAERGGVAAGYVIIATKIVETSALALLIKMTLWDLDSCGSNAQGL